MSFSQKNLITKLSLAVITNAATLKADFIDNALYESIQRLKILFEESLFGGDDAAFPKEMNEISEDFFNLKVLRFTNVLKGQRVDKSVCQKILENKFNHSKLPFSDIRRIAADFYMRLVQFQSKYIRKYTAKEEKNLTAAQMKGLEQTIGVSPIKTRVPKVVASKLKTNIHVAPSKIARSAIPRNV